MSMAGKYWIIKLIPEDVMRPIKFQLKSELKRRNYSSFDKIRATPWLERKGGKTQLAYWLSGGGNKRCIDARCFIYLQLSICATPESFCLGTVQAGPSHDKRSAPTVMWEGKKLDSRDKVSCIIFARYLMRISSDTWKTHKKNRFSRISFPKMTLGADGTRRLDTH